MPVFKVNVKWQKEKYLNVDCNTDENPEVFKAKLFSLTGVPPDRQKVMMPGKILGNVDYSGIKLRDNATVMMMGSAEDAVVKPAMEVEQVAEPQTHTEEVKYLPQGLSNLGNTCYANAVVQLLYTVPEIVASVKACSARGLEQSNPLAYQLHLLFNSIKTADKTITPMMFISMLHRCFPQFAVRVDNKASDGSVGSVLQAMAGGGFQQQDANEFFTELMRTLQRLQMQDSWLASAADLPASLGKRGGWNPVDRFFTGTLKCSLKCEASEEEPSTEHVETFSQLSCFINKDLKYLHTGIRNSLESSLTKYSEVLKKDTEYKKTSRISRLPAYLPIQFVRFFFKEKEKINAKVLRKIVFPISLDMFEFCTPDLQEKLKPMRDKMHARAEQLVHEAPGPKAKRPNEETAKEPDPYDQPELFEPFWLEDDLGTNNSGQYELQAVLTHQGRVSTSGHYVAWAKRKGHWYKFDDDEVTPVSEEEVLKLCGGGDWHCAYVLLYGPKWMRKPTVEETAAPESRASETAPEVAASNGDKMEH